MKLKKRRSLSVGNNNSKLVIILAIVAAVILIGAIIGIVAGVNNAKEQEEFDKKPIRINIASIPDRIVYFVGEEFDPTGFKLQVVTNAQDETYYLDYNEDMQFTGFDSSAPNDSQVITVLYKGFSTTFIVQIKEAPKPTPTLQSIEVYNFKTEYTLADWNKYGPKVTGGRIRCHYSDGSVEEDIILKNSYIYGYTKLDAAGTTEITVKYSVDGKTIETTVEITVTN